jgi:hypothetical protein
MTKCISSILYAVVAIGREKGKISLHLVRNLVDIAHLEEEVERD